MKSSKLSYDQEREEFTLVILVCLFLWSVFAWFLAPYLFIEQGLGDRDRYLAIALNPFEFTASPWGYRIAVPWVARAMSELGGVSIDSSFQALQFTFYFSINLLIYRVSKSLRASRWTIVLALAVYVSGYQYVYYRFNYTHVGIAELSLLAWLSWWLYIRNYSLVMIGLVASILVKESIAFVFLQVLTLNWVCQWLICRRTDITILKLCVICVLPLMLFVAVRLAISAPGESGVGSYLGGYDTTLFNKLFNDQTLMRVVSYFTIFGCLLPTVIYSCKYAVSDSFMRIQLLVFLVSITQLLLGLDAKRMASMAMIAALFLALRLMLTYGLIGWGSAFMGLQVLFGFSWLNQSHFFAVVCIAASCLLAVMFMYKYFTDRGESLAQIK